MDNFEQLYRAYADMVFNLCLHYLQNAPDAEEATQDVFMKVYHRQNQYRGQAQPKTWIYRIAINHCLDVLKSRRRRARWLSFIPFLAHQEPAHFDHPSATLENKETVAAIFSHINNLPDNQKTAIILKSIEGLPQSEIADIMGTTVKAVESLLSRARANLKINIKN